MKVTMTFHLQGLVRSTPTLCLSAVTLRLARSVAVLALAALALPVPALEAQGFGDPIDLRGQALPEWRLEEDLRIGSVEGPHDAFVSIGGVQTDRAGRLLVLDVGAPALKLFDASGEFIRQIGARGEGPGDYLAPGAFGVQGDTVWIADARLGRLRASCAMGRSSRQPRSGTRMGPPHSCP